MTPTQQAAADEMFGLISHADAAAARALADINDLRSITLATIVRLAERHDLPLPLVINTPQHQGIGPCLDLRFERDTDVDDWAGLIGLDPAEDRKGSEPGQRSREAMKMAPRGETVWLAWRAVYIRCYYFDRIPTAAQVAAAILTPDAEVSA